MNKEQLIAELTKRGLTPPEGATNAVLKQLLQEAVAKENAAATPSAAENPPAENTVQKDNSAAPSDSIEDSPAEDPPAEGDPALVRAKEDLASYQPTPAPKGIPQSEIQEKVRAGLTRDQAIEVIQRQRDYDAKQAG